MKGIEIEPLHTSFVLIGMLQGTPTTEGRHSDPTLRHVKAIGMFQALVTFIRQSHKQVVVGGAEYRWRVTVYSISIFDFSE